MNRLSVPTPREKREMREQREDAILWRTMEGVMTLGIGMAALGISFFILKFAPIETASALTFTAACILVLSMGTSMVFLAGGVAGILTSKNEWLFILAFGPVLGGAAYGIPYFWKIHMDPWSWGHLMLSSSLFLSGALLFFMGVWHRKKITARN